ncbi:hypothetical protein SD71_09795 [Cohnella kolymensis]|uniref:CoA-binding domain-containing protein n=1 Tax=Cohnella kolymensis TaxID=1590652 RepID=A0ABR5A5A5_9BACL|nr:acetate--CoA ligase family protein [Cohnella kolymensis]KIL36224.1 hypothetical protein SD71_09795 [Cohnella kolymensis]
MHTLFDSTKGIAIVGAAEKRNYPRSIIQNLLLQGYPREQIYPVNPNYEEVMGLTCYASLKDIPAEIHIAVLVTRRDTVLPILDEAAQCQIKTAVILADGFAEQGPEGEQIQKQLAEFARNNSISILGPNTLGYVHPSNGVGIWAGGEFSDKIRSGGIVLAFQSSGTLNLALQLVCDRNIGLRAGVSVGNEAVVDLADIIDHFVHDPEARVIGVFLESTMRPAKLTRALLNAQNAGKPVIMLKVGRSERARRNAVAHTGRMASSGDAWEALLKRLGVILVQDMDELMETIVLFDHRKPLRKEASLGIATISGGDCSMLSDLAERLDVTLPDVDPETKSILVDALEKPALLGNPLDCENLRRENYERFQTCIRAFCQDPNIEMVAFRMQLFKQLTPEMRELYDYLIEEAKNAGKMTLILTRANETFDRSWYTYFEDSDISFLPSYHTALRAIHHLQEWTRRSARNFTLSPPAAIPQYINVDDEQSTILSWEQTQNWLRESFIPYAPVCFAGSPVDAESCAVDIGFPVAVKLVSALVPHKSEMDAVELNLKTGQEVRLVCERMQANFRHRFPDATEDGFEIQCMVSGGTEMIVGVTTDASVGPVILIGAGGMFTEVMKDIVLAIPPITEEEALALLDELKFSAVLKGTRGRPPLDRIALSRAISSFSRFVVDRQDEIREMDINPLMVMPEGKGVMAVDALITVKNKPNWEGVN